MIIYELEEQSHKKLFIQLCAILVIMKNESNNSRLLKFAEQYNLKEALMNELHAINGMRFYPASTITGATSRGEISRARPLALGDGALRLIGYSTSEYLLNLPFNLRDAFNDSCKHIFDEHGSTPSFKSEILDKLLSKEGNVSDITTERMINVMLEIPKARALVLYKMIDIIMIKNKEVIEKLSSEVKKIILFNLFFILLEEKEIYEEQKIILTNVCQQLNIDNEYIEEFNLLVIKFNSILSELDEIINE